MILNLSQKKKNHSLNLFVILTINTYSETFNHLTATLHQLYTNYTIIGFVLDFDVAMNLAYELVFFLN